MRKPQKLAHYVQIKTLIQGVIEKKGRCRVLAPGNGATLTELDEFLYKESHSFPKGAVEYVQILPVGSPKWTDGNIVPVTSFIGGANRAAMNAGRGKFVLDDLKRGVKSLGNKWHADIVIGHTAPSQHGYHTMTLDGSLLYTGFMKQLEHDETIRVLVVNTQMPKAHITAVAHSWRNPVNDHDTLLKSGCAVHENDVDYIIHVDLPLVEFSMKGAQNPAWKAICGHIVNAGLVKNGKSDIQAGIGGPDAIWDSLDGFTNLGLDTELASDGFVDACLKGIVTGRNRRGALYGKHIMGIVAGTKKIRDFVNENPDVLILPQEWVNGRRQRHEHAVSINAAFGWSVLGDVSSTTRQTANGAVEFFSAIGGQRELIEAIRDAGGTSIIGTPSTYRDAEGVVHSSITAAVPYGVRTSTPAEVVDWLATEHGIVHVAHNDVEEVARRIISIADPRFQDVIWKEAVELYPGILPKSFRGFTTEQAA